MYVFSMIAYGSADIIIHPKFGKYVFQTNPIYPSVVIHIGYTRIG